MRVRTTTAAIVITLLMLAGCKDTTTAGSTTAAPASVSAHTLPDLVGHGLQNAQDTAQAAGFDNLKSHDALGSRHQIWDRDWKVCTQTPAPGSHDTGATVDFGAVKTDEQCPADDTTSTSATPSATPSPTPTSPPTHTAAPKPKPTPKPKPKPKPTHAPTHSSAGGSSGGASGDSGGSGSGPGGGVTAMCNDGTYSRALHHQGACSHHGGVAVFYT